MKTITIQGGKYPVHFGMRAVNTFLHKTGKTLSEIITAKDVVGSLDGIVALAVVGLNEGCRKQNGIELSGEFTDDIVWDFIDEEPQLIFEFLQIFSDEIQPLMNKLEGYAPNL